MSTQKIDTSRLTDVEIYKLILDRKMPRFPKYFWEKPHSLDSARDIVKYLLEEVLKWSDEEIKQKVTREILITYKLNGMVHTLFKSSPYRAVNNAYPDKFKPWEFNVTPFHFWNELTAYEFVKWMIEEKQKWNDEEIKQNFSKTWLVDLGYDRAMDCIKEDTFGIIDKLYPNKFKPWELKQVYMDYWNKETMGEALRWLIEDKLKLDLEKDNIKITNQFLEDNGLGRLSDYIYKYKIPLYDLVNMAYPNKFKEWEILSATSWTEDKKVDAVKWLVEEKLKLNPKTDLDQVRARHFKEYGLNGLLNAFNTSPVEGLKLAYPNFHLK